MDSERAAERAREKANEFLHSLDLTADEREIVHDLYMTMLGAI